MSSVVVEAILEGFQNNLVSKIKGELICEILGVLEAELI